MSTSHRIRKHRSHLTIQNHQSDHKTEKSQALPRPETRKALDAECQDVYLMVNVQPLDRLPWWARQVIRWIYFRYGWAAALKTENGYYSLEYRGVTPDESEARFYSSEPNASYTKVPWRSCLPVETGQYGTHDFPHSEASHRYRKRELQFIQVSRKTIAELEAKVDEVYRSAQA